MEARINGIEKGDTILVPTEFTDVGQTAMDHAANLAKLFNKSITLLHVLDTSILTWTPKRDDNEQKAQERLKNDAADLAYRTGLQVYPLLKKGNIFDTIGEVAEEINAGLVVMGTHGIKGIQHIIGSHALRVINNAHRPFVVVQRKPIGSNGYRNIVMPIDFSRETKQKLALAAELAKKFDSTFHLFAAYESDEYAARAVKNNLSYARQFLLDRGCKVIAEQAKKGDNFPKATVKYAADVEADLIIIMTTLETGLSDLILGPDEQKIIANDEHIPVLTINPVDHMQIAGAMSQ